MAANEEEETGILHNETRRSWDDDDLAVRVSAMDKKLDCNNPFFFVSQGICQLI